MWENLKMSKETSKLDELRAEIDSTDRDIINSLAKRTALVLEIGRYKIAHNIEALDAGRRDALLKRWIETGRVLSLPEDLLRDIFEAIHRHSLTVEKRNL